MRQNLLILYVIVGIGFIYPEIISGRNAPVTTAGSSTVCPGTAVTVPVTVNGFTSIKALTLRLEYDPTLLTFLNYTNLNPSISSTSVNYVNVSPTVTKIMIVWADVAALSLPNGTKLLDLNFTLISGSPTVVFNNTSNSGGDCEYADENGASMNDVPTSTYYFNATIANNAVVPAGTITGANSVCVGTSNVPYSVPAITNATSYIWTVPSGGSIISGNNTQSILVNYSNSAVSGNVTVKGTNSCGQGTPSSLPVTLNPLPVPTISGPSAVCAGSTNVSYTTEPAMTNYSWTISSGGIIAAGSGTNSILVNWNNSGSQSLTVNYAIPGTGCLAATPTVKTITVNPLPVPTITGPTPVCAGSTGNVYTTEPGMTGYQWNLSAGGSAMGGGGPTDNTITITWYIAGPQFVTVNYANAYGCTALIPTTKSVSVSTLPVPTISGPVSVCTGSSGNIYATEPAMTNYQWNVSAGGSVTSGGGPANNTVTISWNNPAPQTVSVNYTNGALCTAQNPSISNITVNPLPVPTITGPVTACDGSTGISYSTETGMSNYLWTISPGGTINSGNGTNNILVSWNTTGAQWVNVNYSNGNGCTATSPSTKNVTVAPLPGAAGTITGPDVVCSGTNGVTYSVPPIANATTYDWTVPADAVITSGSTTNQIVVSFGTTPGTGVITVKGTSVCGSGTVSPDFNVTMVASEAAPVVTASGALLTSSTLTGNQWYYEGTGLIPGETGQTYLATITGWYWTVVLGVGCPSLESNHVYVLFAGQDEMQNKNFGVYPVPSDGTFNVSITSSLLNKYTILIYNQIGMKIFELDDIVVSGTIEKTIDLRPTAVGIYSVVFLSSNHTVVKKVLVR